MNPWKPGGPTWWSVCDGRDHDDAPAMTLDEAVDDFLEGVSQGDILPRVLRLRGFVDDCDSAAGVDDYDCSDSDEHEVQHYAWAFIPTWTWCIRNGRSDDAELHAMIEGPP
jgi:hypothetical protein